MSDIRIHYQVSLSDYRKASYYGLFLRHRIPLLIFFGVLLFAVLYAGKTVCSAQNFSCSLMKSL